MRIPAFALAAALAAAAPAHAIEVTIDFEGLSELTLITNQLQSQGILVSGAANSGCCAPGPGAVLNTTFGTYGVFNFGNSGSKALLYGIPTDVLTIEFVNPDGSDRVVDFASLRVGDGDSASETWRVEFKDLADLVLNSSDHTTFGGPVNGGATVSYTGAGIHSIVVSGLPGGSGGGVDDVTWRIADAVASPEPASLALLGGGILALAARRRRG